VRHYNSSVLRAAARLQAGQFAQALEAADRAVRLRPGIEAVVQRMLCLAKLDDWDAARGSLRRLRDMDREVSSAQIEHFVRVSFCGAAVDEYLAIARKVWDVSGPGSP
jgi:hypothetical protein